MSYLTMMAHRIYYMHKILKNTGSFYLHCDPTMSHYLKILLDIIFGIKNFRNEIVWCYSRMSSGKNQKKLSQAHDIIFFYAKNDNYVFNVDDIRLPYSEGSKKRAGYKKNKLGSGYAKEGICVLNNIGKFPEDWITHISYLRGKERLGYPTQKPEALLERIIKASSNEGDIVADFFCGCGTAITVAEKLKRKWLGVDINHLAISLIEEKRLKPLKAEYEVEGFPKDMAQAEKLADTNKHKFEEWVVEYKFRGHKTKKTGDGGIDGHITFAYANKKILSVIEVKGGGVTINQVRAFKDSISKFNADFGIFVGFSKYITNGMKKEADSLGVIDVEQKGNQYILPFKIKKMYIIAVEDLITNNLPNELITLTYNVTY